jgi:hypothetical protein
MMCNGVVTEDVRVVGYQDVYVDDGGYTSAEDEEEDN